MSRLWLDVALHSLRGRAADSVRVRVSDTSPHPDVPAEQASLLLALGSCRQQQQLDIANYP